MWSSLFLSPWSRWCSERCAGNAGFSSVSLPWYPSALCFFLHLAVASLVSLWKLGVLVLWLILRRTARKTLALRWRGPVARISHGLLARCSAACRTVFFPPIAGGDRRETRLHESRHLAHFPGPSLDRAPVSARFRLSFPPMKLSTTEKSSTTPTTITSRVSPKRASLAACAAFGSSGSYSSTHFAVLSQPVGAFASTVQLSALVACLGFLTHSLVDFNLHIPANALLFFLMANLATTEIRQSSSPNSQIGKSPSQTSKSLMDLVLLTV